MFSTEVRAVIITIANVEKVISHWVCPDLKWKMHGELFSADVRVLPLGRCDMVLGVQWLETLGPVNVNFKTKEMQFHYLGKDISLKGIGEDPN